MEGVGAGRKPCGIFGNVAAGAGKFGGFSDDAVKGFGLPEMALPGMGEGGERRYFMELGGTEPLDGIQPFLQRHARKGLDDEVDVVRHDYEIAGPNAGTVKVEQRFAN